MNKFKKYILENGKYLSSGCDRTAYLLNGKVYKFPYTEGSSQGDFEFEIYHSLHSKFKKFFPNPKWYGRIVEMDKVEIANNIVDFYSPYDRDNYRLEGEIRDWAIYSLLEANGLDTGEIIDELYELFEWIEAEGGLPEDLVNNTGNFGLLNNQIVFVDWGWSTMT